MGNRERSRVSNSLTHCAKQPVTSSANGAFLLPSDATAHRTHDGVPNTAEERNYTMQMFKSFLVEEEGAEIAEYALLVVILALGLLTAGTSVQDALKNAFTQTSKKVDTNANSLAAA